ncbi:MdtA/MuxA family multidrug efflux RND transporter periplasmic adaptor subunit [Methylomicrobium sp. Wu6]|uniref:MdtA/MuxA family multidrug efflux RND transporter periplasmic adaptor subunit n=1 Tax=Methylomicrobium sp. Wu6 TaxID=3107928 RepID=UPI002DD62CAB|nr:MdtA/MuxA family multidrug efflux RND transporter periplasmic adaptor subunit [Methylomicrobium sp. Wu6]MEC4748620.1 MdtA/MuxA family multidrug efflux RND transporter periplasmic adaptor subunit [Methylomicrobium sp. Wu6]
MNQDKRHVDLAASQSRCRPSWLFWLLLLMITAAVVYSFRQPTAQGQDHGSRQTAEKRSVNGDWQKNPPVSVGAVTAYKGDMPIYLSGLGTVTALRTVTVHSRVDGELIRVAFTEGQLVRQGDLLVEIDPRPFQVQLKQAEGQLLRDQALLKNAEIDMNRYQILLEQDSIAAQQTATQAALVKQYQGVVEMDQAQVDNAKLQLIYARITAPIQGRIGLRLIDQGNIVHAGDSNGLLVITQTQPISVVFTLPEDVVPAVMNRWHSGESIGVDAYDRAGVNKLATGKLLAVDNQIDSTTGTLKLKAQFDNENRALFANQFVNIKMKLDTLSSATLVPTAAIQRGANGAFVYVVNDDSTISVRLIKTGAVEGEIVAILEGLIPGEKLVIEGGDKLREGSKVNVVKLDNKPLQPASNQKGRQTPAGSFSR